MRKPRQIIGQMACTCCGKVQPVHQQSNGYAIQTCGWCNSTLQAFGPESDKLIRQRAGISQAEPEKVPEVAPKAAEQIRKPNPAAPAEGSGFWGKVDRLLSDGGAA